MTVRGTPVFPAIRFGEDEAGMQGMNLDTAPNDVFMGYVGPKEEINGELSTADNQDFDGVTSQTVAEAVAEVVQKIHADFREKLRQGDLGSVLKRKLAHEKENAAARSKVTKKRSFVRILPKNASLSMQNY